MMWFFRRLPWSRRSPAGWLADTLAIAFVLAIMVAAHG